MKSGKLLPANDKAAKSPAAPSTPPIAIAVGVRTVGLRVTSTTSTKLTIVSTNGAASYGRPVPQLIFRPSADTNVPLTTMLPRSVTPAEKFVASDLADYLVVTKAPADAPADVVRVGGLPGRRAYFRFNIPARILDSSNVVRATLLLTQRPNGLSPGPRDSVALQQFVVVAGPAVTDLSRALLFLSAPRKTDTTRFVAADSGERSLEVISVVRDWRSTTVDRTPRALALRATTEGLTGGQIDFFSIEAPLAVRPKLRLTYLPQQAGGIR